MARRLNHTALREMRELVGISGRELARRCGLSENSIGNLERTGHDVTPATMRKIADALGVALDAITYPVPDAAGQPEDIPA